MGISKLENKGYYNIQKDKEHTLTVHEMLKQCSEKTFEFAKIFYYELSALSDKTVSG